MPPASGIRRVELDECQARCPGPHGGFQARALAVATLIRTRHEAPVFTWHRFQLSAAGARMLARVGAHASLFRRFTERRPDRDRCRVSGLRGQLPGATAPAAAARPGTAPAPAKPRVTAPASMPAPSKSGISSVNCRSPGRHRQLQAGALRLTRALFVALGPPRAPGSCTAWPSKSRCPPSTRPSGNAPRTAAPGTFMDACNLHLFRRERGCRTPFPGRHARGRGWPPFRDHLLGATPAEVPRGT